jgi:hypothetical protein
VEYNGEVALTLRVLIFNIKILPKKKKRAGPHSMSPKKAEKIKKKLQAKQDKKAQKALQKKQKKQEKKAQKRKGAKKKKLSLSDVLDIIGLVKDVVAAMVKTFFGHLRIDLARLHIRVATGDAATTAIAYGAISDALVHLFHILEGVKGFDLPETRDVSVNADFLAEELDILIQNLVLYKEALENHNEDALADLLREGAARKSDLDTL